jgi:Zn-dependent protease
VIGATFGNRNTFKLFSVGGIPIRAHVSLPLGFLIVSRLTFSPGAWLGFVVLVVAHELGHAALLRRYRCEVTEIVLHVAGGECRAHGVLTPFQSAVVASGGVLAQLLLFGAMATLTTLGVWSAAFVASPLYYTLTAMNLGLAALNLLPIWPLDGREIWKLPYVTFQELSLWWLRRKLARLARRKRSHLRRIQ